MKFIFSFALSLSSLGLLATPAYAEDLVLAKLWWWPNEVQLQLNSIDGRTGYLFHLKLINNVILAGSYDTFGAPARPFVDSCLLRDLVEEAIAKRNVPDINVFGPSQVILPLDSEPRRSASTSYPAPQLRYSAVHPMGYSATVIVDNEVPVVPTVRTPADQEQASRLRLHRIFEYHRNCLPLDYGI